MKVLHIYRGYYPELAGGVLEVMRQVSFATRALGASTTIFALSPAPVLPQAHRPEALIIRSRSWIAPASCDLGGLDAFQTYRRLASQADVLHFHYPWPFGDLLRLSSCVKKPAVVTYHSDVVRQRLFDQLYGPLRTRFLGSMHAVIATSPAYARSSPVLKSLQADKVVTIPLGLDESTAVAASVVPEDPQLHSLLDRLDGRPFFLFVGVLRYYKGLDFLIDAARRSGQEVVIVGQGPLRAELERRVETVPNVHLTGAVSEAAKYLLIRRAVACVLPSHLRSEAFGVSLIESALCGVPMISCEIGTGTSYVNVHEQTGFVVPPRDPDALAHAMNRLAGDLVLRERLGRQARERYERLFSGPALGSATMRLYENVLAGRAPGEGIV